MRRCKRIACASQSPARPGPICRHSSNAGAQGVLKRFFVTRGEKRLVIDLRTRDGQAFRLRAGDTTVVDRRKWRETE